MTEELYNKLSLYKDSILYLRFNSFENMNTEEIKNHFEKSITNIKNILNNIQNDKNIDIFINIITEIKRELRRELLKECQEKAAVMNQYGTQYIEAEDYNQILIRNYLIELCKDAINEVQNPQEDKEIKEPNKNKIYIYSSKMPETEDDFKSMKIIREDLESIPLAYYGSFLKVIEDMRSGNYDGKEHKCKVLNNPRLDNTFEHRAYHGVRLYENTIETHNNKIAKRIKKIEQELGAEIHFVYKLEIKKCNQTNGLDEEREKRYKNERRNYEELMISATKEEIQALADATYNLVKKYINDNKKKQSEEEANEEIALYTVLDIINTYLHTNYDLNNNSEFEFTGERAIENERYQIYKRVLIYLNSKELEELKELSKIFNLIDNINNDNCPTDKEKDKIISIIMYLLREMTLEELKETEINILLLIDYKDEYLIKDQTQKEEGEYGRK